jgi:hypothetical protein
METRIVEAVGLGYKPGPVGFRKRMVRGLMRGFVWALHRGIIPLAARQAAMFGALRFRSKLMRVPFLAGGSIGDTFENDLMKLIFNATAIANIADNASASPLTNLYVSLHTADPGETGNQTTSEATYTSYARVAVARSGSGWTVTNNSVSPAASISFPAGTGGSGTVTHFAIGTALSSTGKILFSGTVSPNITTGNTITPVLTTATAITID